MSRSASAILDSLPLKLQRLGAIVHRMGFASVGQIARYYYSGNPNQPITASDPVAKEARRDLGEMVKRKALKSFSINNTHGRGAPRKVFCALESRPPINKVFIPHRLEISEFAFVLRAGCAQEQDLSLDFRIEYGLTRHDEHRPDMVFAISGPSGTGLYLVEIDLATETLKSANRKQSDIWKKLRRYTGLSGEDLNPYRELFQYDFTGFRCVIATKRPASIIRICNEFDTGDKIGVADLPSIIPNSVIREKIWTVDGLGTGPHSLDWPPIAEGS